MDTAYIILGGNVGNRQENLELAAQLIEKQAGAIANKSDIYVTAAWGNTAQPDFYNQALCIKTLLTAVKLLETLLNIEKEMGRTRGEQKWTERIIDIDILFFNEEIISEPNLKIPHPYIQERRFVLVPLAQIAGEIIHPQSGKTVNKLLSECPDTSEVHLLK
jgi:2-amino-4-hydroxy-6-hydroxymethyldihydropteridine diphosphokinase